MRSGYLLALLLTAGPLFGDRFTLQKTTVNGQVTLTSSYEKGSETRFDVLRADRTPASINILNRDTKITLILDPSSEQYVQLRAQSPDLLLLLAQRIERSRDSGKAVHIYYETIDTHERKEFFGQMARHLIVRERRVADPGACQPSYQSEKEGWYLPRKAAFAGAILSFVLQCRDKLIYQGNPSPGLAVLETSGGMTRELLDISDQPLDPAIFEIPPGYKKVSALPKEPYLTPTATQRLELDWTTLERAIRSWFN